MAADLSGSWKCALDQNYENNIVKFTQSHYPSIECTLYPHIEGKAIIVPKCVI